MFMVDSSLEPLHSATARDETYHVISFFSPPWAVVVALSSSPPQNQHARQDHCSMPSKDVIASQQAIYVVLVFSGFNSLLGRLCPFFDSFPILSFMTQPHAKTNCICMLNKVFFVTF